VSETFDLVAHHRERTRKAEQRNAFLEAQNAKLYRLLALAVRIASNDGRDCDPTVLTAAIEELDTLTLAETARGPGPSIDQLGELLRATDPDRIARGEAA
jgi:hypothetical protein